MAVTQVGTPGAVQQSSGNTAAVTGVFSGTQPRTAGDLLVACVTTFGTTTGVIGSFTAGWTQQVSQGSSTLHLTVAIYTKVAAGGDAAPTITPANTGTTANARTTIEMIELTGQDATTPVVTTGTGDNTVSPLTITSAGNVTRSGSYGVSSAGATTTSATTGTYTPGSSPAWTNIFNQGATSQRPHAASDDIANPATGSTLTDKPTWSGGTLNEFTGCLIVVQPPVAGPPVPIRPAFLLHGPAAAVKGKLASILIKPPTVGGPAAPFFPPRVLLHGPAAAVKGKLAGARGQPGRPSPFRLPGLLKGPADAQPGKLTGLRGRPGVPAPFTPPHSPLRGPAAAVKGKLASVAAPPPIIPPNIPAPFFAPHTLLRGQAGVRARTPLTGATAPPPPPPPAQVPRWQGSTHILPAGASGNLILGANHTGTGGAGDPKGDFERSGD